MLDRLRELEARQDELTDRLSSTTADIPDIHPNVAGIYRRKVERLAEALSRPEERDEASAAIRGLIERITLSPGPKRGQVDAVLYGDLGTIIEWTAVGDRKGRKNKTDTPVSGMSVSVVAGACNRSSLVCLKASKAWCCSSSSCLISSMGYLRVAVLMEVMLRRSKATRVSMISRSVSTVPLT